MEKPKVELKKVKTFQGRDGYGLNAEVYIDGVYCMFVIDDGNGGCLDFQYNLKAGKDNYNAMIKQKIKSLEDYIATLPDEVSEFMKDDGKPFTFKQTLESYINQLVDEMEEAKNKAKFQKKMVKLFETAIVFGVPDSGKYRYVSFRNPIKFYDTPAYRNIVQNGVDDIKRKYCTDGVQILNNNLKPMGITY
jgi:hypothetical protein